MKVLVLTWVIALALAFTQAGCMGSTGWRFEVGVSPVKELSNTAGLKQAPAKLEKY